MKITIELLKGFVLIVLIFPFLIAQYTLYLIATRRSVNRVLTSLSLGIIFGLYLTSVYLILDSKKGNILTISLNYILLGIVIYWTLFFILIPIRNYIVQTRKKTDKTDNLDASKNPDEQQ